MITMIGTTLRLVFARRGYVIGAILTTLLTAALYAWAGQIVTVFADGTVFVDPEPTRLAALVVVSLLIGLVLPVQVFAVRRAAWGIRQGGTGLVGFVAALSSPCCSPLILPAILSFAGFSGSSLLSLKVTLYRYFVPLAALSVIFLALSLVLAARDVTRACALTPGPAQSRAAGNAVVAEPEDAPNRRNTGVVGRSG